MQMRCVYWVVSMALVVQNSAIFHFRIAIRMNRMQKHYFYGYLLRSRLFSYDEAEEHYKSAMKLRPEDVTSYNDCAIMLVRQNRSSERVLELQPKHAIAHFNWP
eukprot:408969_1